ncbi:MAG: hypothetical protein N2Z74_09805, partial [Syntrophales bacterium]|nr:hypothetical protein [Syntrophales bacterium]
MLMFSEHDGVTVIKCGTEVGGEVPYWTYCYRYGGLLFDAGCPHTAVELQAFVREAHLRALLITHYHEDLGGGASALD